MSKQPPLLPAEMLRRVIRVARTNGTCVMVISSLVALAAAASQDKLDTFIGLAVAGTAAMELHGTVLLGGGEWRGFRWLIFSQFLLLALILGYVGYRMNHVDRDALAELNDYVRRLAQLFADMPLSQVSGANEVLEFKVQQYQEMYLFVGFGTIAYQGGMILYYALRGRAVRLALPQE